MERSTSSATRAVTLVFALAIVLRIFHLGFQSLWLDEALTLHWAERPTALEVASALLSKNVHPPLYFLLVHYWQAAVGTSEIALRSLSVVWSVLGLYLLFRLGRRVGGPGTALAVLVIAATSLYQIWFAQEARSYAMSMALGTGAMLLFWQNLERASWARQTALGVLAFALFITHYINGSLLVTLGLFAIGAFFALRRSGHQRDSLFQLMQRCSFPGLGLGATLCGLWFLKFSEQIRGGGEVVWYPVPSVGDLVELFPSPTTHPGPKVAGPSGGARLYRLRPRCSQHFVCDGFALRTPLSKETSCTLFASRR